MDILTYSQFKVNKQVFHLWACLVLPQSNSAVPRTRARVGRTCLRSFKQQALSSYGKQDKRFGLKKKSSGQTVLLNFAIKTPS